MTNRDCELSCSSEIRGPEGSRQDELGCRVHNVRPDKHCPICQVALASSAELITHVEREHCDFLRSETVLDSDVYEKFVADNYEWMKHNLETELFTKLEIHIDAKRNSVQEMQSRTFNKDEDDRSSVTSDIVPKVKSQLSGAVRVVLCSNVDHYASCQSDIGWGCAYRNIQMLLSCLQNQVDYKDRLLRILDGNELSTGAVPSISRLQRLIEEAWSNGFDPQGALQLRNTLVNTRKWIGATEVVTLFAFLKIRCLLIDFHTATGPNSTHPALFDWVKNYFESKMQDDFTPPLFLQHQGHSRTIIGFEEQRQEELNLLMLDPSCSKEKMMQIEDPTISPLLLLRVCQSSMRALQYQIVAVVGTVDSEYEYNNSKILRSERVP